MTLLPQRDAGLALGCVKYLRLSFFHYLDIVAPWSEVISARLCDGATLTRHCHAMKMVSSGDLSKRQAMMKFGIPRSTMALRLKHPGVMPISLGRFKRVFSDEFEKELVDYT